MAIVWASAGAGVATETSGAALSPLCPATVNAGDILIIQTAWEGTTSGPTDPPTGFTKLGSSPYNVGSASTVARHWIFGKIADGTEDGAAVALGAPAVTTQRAARIHRFTGRVAGSITDLVPSASFSNLVGDTDPTGPSVTTTVAGALAVAAVYQNDNNTLETFAGSSDTWTERGTVGGYIFALTPGGVLDLLTATPAADPGTVSGGAMTVTNDPWGVIGFEIRPSLPPITGSGTPDAQSSTASGSGISSSNSTDGAISAQAADINGAGNVRRDLYWVGGDGDWDNVAGTKWARTSGGAGGESIPTQYDNVFIDANSGNVTVTLSTATAVCRDIDFTGFTGTLASASAGLECWGSFTLGAAMTWANTSALRFMATDGPHTITSNGINVGTVGFVEFIGAGGVWELGDDFYALLKQISLIAGELRTNNHGIHARVIVSSGSAAFVFLMGSSTLELGGAAALARWSVSNPNFSCDAGTSTLKLIPSTNTGITIAAGSSTVALNNVVLDGDFAAGTKLFISTVGGALEIASLDFTASDVRIFEVDDGGDVTLGDLIATGTPSDIFTIRSQIPGSPFDLTKLGAPIELEYLSVADSHASPADTWYALNSTDAGGNTGWIFVDVGEGALSAQDADIAGAGLSASVGVGALVSQAAPLDGSGVSESLGTGALAAASAGLEGTGAAGATIEGTGALSAQQAAMAGAGLVQLIEQQGVYIPHRRLPKPVPVVLPPVYAKGIMLAKRAQVVGRGEVSGSSNAEIEFMLMAA